MLLMGSGLGLAAILRRGKRNGHLYFSLARQARLFSVIPARRPGVHSRTPRLRFPLLREPLLTSPRKTRLSAPDKMSPLPPHSRLH
jgi:hypothetical protein